MWRFCSYTFNGVFIKISLHITHTHTQWVWRICQKKYLDIGSVSHSIFLSFHWSSFVWSHCLCNIFTAVYVLCACMCGVRSYKEGQRNKQTTLLPQSPRLVCAYTHVPGSYFNNHRIMTTTANILEWDHSRHALKRWAIGPVGADCQEREKERAVFVFVEIGPRSVCTYTQAEATAAAKLFVCFAISYCTIARIRIYTRTYTVLNTYFNNKINW